MSRQWIIGLCSIPFLSSYLYVVQLALNPQVSVAYRAYYIDRTTTISPTELKRQKDFQPGIWVQFDQNDIILFDRWAGPESEYRWSDGDSASLFVLLPENPDLTGTMEIVASYHGRQRVEIAVNGSAVAVSQEEGPQSVINVDFDVSLLRGGEVNEISFRFPDARYPSLLDRRKIAMAFKQLRIR